MKNKRLQRFNKYIPQAIFGKVPLSLYNHKWLRRAVYAVCAVPNLGFFNKNKSYITHIDIICTTKCTLNCKNCTAHVPYFQNASDFDADSIIEDVKKMLKGFDKIASVSLIGGEPLLYKDLDKILEFLIPQKNIGHIKIVTNGTLIPKNGNLIKLLQNKKVSVSISDYKDLSPRVKDGSIQKFLDENKINYRVMELGEWRDFGGTEHQPSTEKELEEQYYRCDKECFVFYDGKLHTCPKSAFGTALGYVPNRESDSIDFRNQNKNVSELKKDVNKFLYDLPYISACAYCNAGTERYVPIKPAVQAEGKLTVNKN